MEEGCHLLPRHESIRAEAGVVRRVTSTGDPGRAQTIDIGFENRIIVVDEQVTALRRWR
jgi:hypothetical protein